ncbi:PIN domain-containing protein [Mucilaginibacter sp. CAU 1740]|uniref:type II toxin-antitoxin system VapC family toxin n=1 Tax=Mucilaginibacter sp. CAU 1740 TaxID=3140365 RepID=UPI00325C0EFB
MNLFLDSDILLDVILDRIPHYEFSGQVLLLADQPDFYCCTTVHALLNVHYVTKRHLGLKIANEAVVVLFNKVHIIPEDSTTIEQAMQSDFKDFEDAVQYFAAKSAGADAIITRNIKDYTNSTIPVLTAEQFLNTL